MSHPPAPRRAVRPKTRTVGALVGLIVGLSLLAPLSPSAAAPQGRTGPVLAGAVGSTAGVTSTERTTRTSRTRRISAHTHRPNPRVMRRDRARCPRGHVALTIDGGPHPTATVPMVRALRKAKAPAAFFMTGRNVDARPEMAAWVASRGFQIANHSYNHHDMANMSRAQIDSELNRTRNALRRAGITPSRYFRFPKGSRTAPVQNYVSSRGYTIAGWNIPSHDLQSSSTREIVQRVTGHLRRTQRRSNIVLLHDSRDHSDLTVAAIPHIVKRARAMGFCLSPLRDNNGRFMFAETGPGPYHNRGNGLR